MIAGEWVILFGIAMFCLGILAGRQQGKEICTRKVYAILEQYGFKHDDENNGDA